MVVVGSGILPVTGGPKGSFHRLLLSFQLLVDCFFIVLHKLPMVSKLINEFIHGGNMSNKHFFNAAVLVGLESGCEQ